MRQRDTLTNRCIEHCFVFVHFDLDANWLKSNSMCSHPQLFLHVRQESTRGSQSLAVPCRHSWTAGGRSTSCSLSHDPAVFKDVERLLDSKALLVLDQPCIPLLGCHLVEQYVGALELYTLKVIQRPHVLVVEEDMWLRNERLAIGADEALILHDVSQVPPVVAGLPLALANESAHRRGFATLVAAAEHLFIGPVAGLRAIRAYLAIDGIHDCIFTDHTRDQTRPATVRIHIADILEGDWLVAVGLGQARILLPPLAVLVVPARILKLKPLEIFFGHGIDAPEVGEPAGGKELSRLMHVSLVRNAVPGLLDVLVVDLQTVLLQRHQIAAIVVIIDPAPPHLGVAFPLFATILRSVLDEGADSCIDESVVVPEGILQVALQQQLVIGVG